MADGSNLVPSQIASNPNDPRFVNDPNYAYDSNNGGWTYQQTQQVDDVVVTGRRSQVSSNDQRVRLRAQPGQETAVYGAKGEENILSILHETGGLLFPFTPSITVDQTVDYKTVDLTHANYDINAYSRTPSVTINVTGKFTVQNQREGQYVLAVLHFLRVVSKMHFGETDPKAGLPPPILYFQGYGPYMFNGLKCVLKNHSYALEDSVDYVSVTAADGTTTRLPALMTVSLSLGVQQTPAAMRKNFNLEEFRTGELIRSSKGWI